MNDSSKSTSPSGDQMAATAFERSQPEARGAGGDGGSGVSMSYLKFGAMILTSGVAMFILMYVNSYQLSHAKWSETRFYMTFVMIAVMAVIMLGFMLSMYKDARMNLAIVGASALVFVGALWLVRSQETVQDTSWMSAMIPHHSIAILTSERAEISDVRVCELATGIIEAQQREIDEMNWLIDDIAENGIAATAAEAESRSMPDFAGTSIRSCP
jgi:hypothetical protein